MIILRPLYVKSQSNCGDGVRECEGFVWDEEEEDEEEEDEEDEEDDNEDRGNKDNCVKKSLKKEDTTTSSISLESDDSDDNESEDEKNNKKDILLEPFLNEKQIFKKGENNIYDINENIKTFISNSYVY